MNAPLTRRNFLDLRFALPFGKVAQAITSDSAVSRMTAELDAFARSGRAQFAPKRKQPRVSMGEAGDNDRRGDATAALGGIHCSNRGFDKSTLSH